MEHKFSNDQTNGKLFSSTFYQTKIFKWSQRTIATLCSYIFFFLLLFGPWWICPLEMNWSHFDQKPWLLTFILNICSTCVVCFLEWNICLQIFLSERLFSFSSQIKNEKKTCFVTFFLDWRRKKWRNLHKLLSSHSVRNR